MDESLDQWPSVCQSDVALTYQHLTQDVDRLTPVAMPRFSFQQDWSQICKEAAGLVLWWSPVSHDKAAWWLYARCAGTLFCWTLSWFSAFDFIKNTKYASDRKFTDVHVCQNYQNRAWFDKVIAKVKWCSFFTHMGSSSSSSSSSTDSVCCGQTPL